MRDQTLFFQLAATPTPTAMTIVGMILRLAAVLVVAGALVGVLAVVRRGFRHGDHPKARDFSLGDLRALHREGKLSTEEFERAKGRIVEQTRSTILKNKQPSQNETPLQHELKDA